MKAVPPCARFHAGVKQTDLVQYAERNWKAITTDTRYLGWISSWRDMAGLPDYMEDFLHKLFVWPQCAVIHLIAGQRPGCENAAGEVYVAAA